MKSVLVDWEESSPEKMTGWYLSSAVTSAFTEIEVKKYQSLGFLVDNNDKAIVLASSLQGDNYGELLRIPKCKISSIQEINFSTSNTDTATVTSTTNDTIMTVNNPEEKEETEDNEEDNYTVSSLLWEKDNLSELPTMFHGVNVQSFIEMYSIMSAKELSRHFNVTIQVVKVLSSILLRMGKVERKSNSNIKHISTSTSINKSNSNNIDDSNVNADSTSNLNLNLSGKELAKKMLRNKVDKYYKIKIYSFYLDYTKGMKRAMLAEKYKLTKNQVDGLVNRLKRSNFIDSDMLDKRKQNKVKNSNRKTRLRARTREVTRIKAKAKAVVKERVKARERMQLSTATSTTAAMSNNNKNTNTNTSININKSHFGTTKVRANSNSNSKPSVEMSVIKANGFSEENFVKDFYKNTYRGLSDIYGIPLEKIKYMVKKLRRHGVLGRKYE